MQGTPFGTIGKLCKNLLGLALEAHCLQALAVLICLLFQVPGDALTTVSADPLSVEVDIDIDVELAMHMDAEVGSRYTLPQCRGRRDGRKK